MHCEPPGNLLINLYFMVNVGIRVAKKKPSGGTNYESSFPLSPADLVQSRNFCFHVVWGLMVRHILMAYPRWLWCRVDTR